MVLGRAAHSALAKLDRARSTLHHDGQGGSWAGDQLGKHEGNGDGKWQDS